MAERDAPHAVERAYASKERHAPLHELLPLARPLSVLVDPSSGCNLRCNYCPTGHPELFGGPSRGLMSQATFAKVVGGLGEFPAPVEKLHLYTDGEPLLNPHLGWMAELAVSSGVARSVELTTNGLLLSAQVADVLLAAGIHRVRISVQPSVTGARQDRHAVALFDRCLANVRRLREKRDRLGSPLEIHAKSLDLGRDDPLLERFATEFGRVADSIHLDSAMGWSGSTDFDFMLGSTPESDMTGEVPLRRRRVVCPEPFYSLAVNHDGTVSACCVDWAREAVVGDVTQASLVEIWAGEGLRAFRQLHLDGRRSEHRACRGCQYVQGAPLQADLDDRRAALLPIYRSGGGGSCASA
jgi:radical SAM protein with 4Fe4S-binding SPASM domain